MSDDFFLEDQKFAFDNCKMLYSRRKMPFNSSCMAFGWETGFGWYRNIRDMSTRLEALNLLFYPKYGVRVVVEQCKQKWGRLTVYTSVETHPKWYFRVWHIPFMKARQWLEKNVDYGIVKVMDEESHYYDRRELVPEGDIDKEKELNKGVSNVKFDFSDGKWFKTTKIFSPTKFHFEMTKNRFVHRLSNVLWKIGMLLDFRPEPSPEQLVAAEALEQFARKIVLEEEEDCYSVCEQCGAHIGTDYSPRVATKGWVSYICDRCDAKDRIQYAKQRVESLSDGDPSTAPHAVSEAVKAADELLNSDKFVPSSDIVEAANRLEKAVDGLASKGKRPFKTLQLSNGD